ncbi:zinc finger CCCH domain-containing protein 14 isoform X2 [Anomaloglossus baeobatrachus]|uniref:zinc finger CCCH domain-containing protein 14 isoform X2 n=1 Tax=Anomaloglossus baeobatrachus TaxID=238106 RepID=UPI003F5056DD
MEIGTEISRKIRTAIKGKLQELDEELPDYIMVMVANKKSQDQMTDDLSLFLGNNTARFTTWLQGVLDKLRSVTPETNSLKASEAIIFNSSMPPLKSVPPSREEPAREAPPARQERLHSDSRPPSVRVSADAVTAARLTSAVKPMYEFSPSDAIIDIKLDSDDPFIDDLSYGPDNLLYSRKRSAAAVSTRPQRPAAPLYRPPGSGQSLYQVTEHNATYRPQPARPKDPQVSRLLSATRMYDPQDVGPAEEAYLSTMVSVREGDSSRKRKIPVASSVVKVKRLAAEEEEDDDEEEEEEENLSRAAGLLSSVSVPSRPERRPTLPPSKQANKNLILKAISEAQESITKTTSYSAAAPKQMVPVAPRTRLLPEEELIPPRSRESVLRYLEPEEAAVMDPTPHTAHPTPGAAHHALTYTAAGRVDQRRMDVLSRLQPDPSSEAQLWSPEEVAENLRPTDSRSFILKRPKITKDPAVQGIPTVVEGQLQPSRLIQPRESVVPEKPPSPKFIVTLEGVPSPPGYLSDQEAEEEPMCYTEQGEEYPEAYSALSRTEPGCPIPQDPPGTHESSDVPPKAKIAERCKYWPACKNAERCTYHHPTTPCKAFPKCRFAEKCFFIHPNCKFDARCTKADCPYTHASRRMPAPPIKPVAHIPPVVQQCRYFPSCKKTECPFYHPKHCRFSSSCTRPDCEYYHPTVPVPPRHALTWTRTQASD